MMRDPPILPSAVPGERKHAVGDRILNQIPHSMGMEHFLLITMGSKGHTGIRLWPKIPIPGDPPCRSANIGETNYTGKTGGACPDDPCKSPPDQGHRLRSGSIARATGPPRIFSDDTDYDTADFHVAGEDRIHLRIGGLQADDRFSSALLVIDLFSGSLLPSRSPERWPRPSLHRWLVDDVRRSPDLHHEFHRRSWRIP